VTKPARKVLMIGVMLQFLEQFSGLFGLLFFVSTIFEYSGSSISPNASSIIVGIIQIIGCYCSTLLVDRAGRKILISTSAFGISLGMFVFALYSYLRSNGVDLTGFNWIPLAAFSFTLWIANLGVLSLPFLVTSELIITLPNVRTGESDNSSANKLPFLPRSKATFTSFACACRGCLLS
jgi:Sugar (and other) transporter